MLPPIHVVPMYLAAASPVLPVGRFIRDEGYGAAAKGKREASNPPQSLPPSL
jgi:hypothetical protein